jgi:hypothetical protein
LALTRLLLEVTPPQVARAMVALAPAAGSVGGYIRVAAPDRRAARLPLEIKRRLEPRAVVELAARLAELSSGARLIIASYLSPAARERLRQANLAFVDLTGNIRLELTEPGLYIETQGADVDPDRKEHPSRSLRGGKAGRIVRALLDAKQPPGVRELAELAGVNPGYVSRVVSLLDREALIERRGRGRIVAVDWPRLLRRWAEDAPLSSRGTQTTCLEPRGPNALLTKLGDLRMRYAITGALAAAKLAPVAPPRLATIYVDDAAKAMTTLGLSAADRGANVLLIEPEDEGVFTGAIERNGLSYVAASQTAADLLTSPGRGPAEAGALIEWMSKHEEAWRG